ncbi:MAG TPA: GNAT family N-acetyltransferase [Rubrobacteraceae bacterium]|nr:GNAT family N-acetyltransferase [Rubrobacteraceae bacterium]
MLVSAFNAEPWNERWTLDTARKDMRWTLDAPGALGFVYLEDGIRGFAAGYREQDADRIIFYLSVLCVSPAYQRKGIGSRLMRHLKETLTEMGIRSIYLLTDRGTPAETFYEKNGYKVSPQDILMFHEWQPPAS